MSFAELKLNANLLRAVEACGFVTPTEIQSRAIPLILAGRDLMASAQTGTGKTAAFVLPVLERLSKPSPRRGRGPRFMVLTPTRELATQINDDIRKFSRYSRMTSGSVLGGLSYGPQIRLLEQPLDLLVATPGRLLDHMNSGRVDFSRLETFVLDEADRMLDMGFINDVKKIGAALPDARQTLLFSATLEGRVLSIARELLDDPATVQLAHVQEQHALIEQLMHHADDATHKRRLLAHHLSCHTMTQALIFTATKRKADKLARALSGEGHSTAALHGDMGQGARRRTMEQMRGGHIKFLVATDVASRGLDLKGVSHVINFELPMVPEDYIHRIGRTGRAGANGKAVSLIGPEDWDRLSGIERLTGQRIARAVIPGLEPVTSEPTRGHSKRPQQRSHRRPQQQQKQQQRYRQPSWSDNPVSTPARNNRAGRGHFRKFASRANGR